MLLSKNLKALNPGSNTLSGKISSGRSEEVLFPNEKEKLKLKSKQTFRTRLQYLIETIISKY